MKKILYLGWVGHKNLGDDLLLNIFTSLSSKYMLTPYRIIPSYPGVDTTNLSKYDLIVLGGGSLIDPYFINILYNGIKLGKKVMIWGSGIDQIDESDLNKLKAGKSADLSGLFNAEDAKILRRTFAKAVYAGVRGPLTKRALISLGVKEEHIKIIGDPGLLLPVANMNSWNKKNKTIAINWGTSYNKIYGKNELEVEDQLVIALSKMIKEGYKVLIYTVWDKDRPIGERLYKNINDTTNFILDTKLYTENELIQRLSSTSISINFKMHPNLISLSAGVPSIALGYRYKVFDLFYSLGLNDLVISTGDQSLSSKIIKLIKSHENENKTITEYATQRKKYMPLIIKPFKNNLFLK